MEPSLNGGMPVQSPFYWVRRVVIRVDIAKLFVAPESPEVIAASVPQPLVYDGTEVHVSLTRCKTLLEGFSEDDCGWDEIVIQIPVTYADETWLYNTEVYINNSLMAIASREIYGQPKTPAQVAAERKDDDFRATVSRLYSNREVLRFAFEAIKGGPPGIPPVGMPPGRPPGRPEGIGFIPEEWRKKVPGMINLKQIPSAMPNHAPAVKQLVAMNYGKPVIHKFVMGKGELIWFEGAPEYLRKAGLSRVKRASFLDTELDINGGRIVYDYLAIPR